MMMGKYFFFNCFGKHYSYIMTHPNLKQCFYVVFLLASLTFADMRSTHIPSHFTFFTAASSSAAVAHDNMSVTKFSRLQWNPNSEDAQHIFTVLLSYKQNLLFEWMSSLVFFGFCTNVMTTKLLPHILSNVK